MGWIPKEREKEFECNPGKIILILTERRGRTRVCDKFKKRSELCPPRLRNIQIFYFYNNYYFSLSTFIFLEENLILHFRQRRKQR